MIISRDSQAIIAQCTPKGNGALALIRISGDNAVDVANLIVKLSSGKILAYCQTHTIHYASIVKQNELIDRVMIFLMRAPKTFTGQDTVEITCHNNQFLIEHIIQEAITHGARLADPGEFSKRAFLNGKIDLLQAEAINELIHANNQHALKQSLEQLDGSFSHRIALLQKRLMTCYALCQASFEFLDEETIEFGDQIIEHIQSVLHDIATIKKTFDQQKQIRQGIRIAFIGSVNAGKSSLFNALLQQPRAIVTEIAGTTRDCLEAGVYHNGMYWTLVDTAGIRQTDEVIEKEGVRRSLEQAHKADIIVLVYDRSREMFVDERICYYDLFKKYGRKSIVVANKSDLVEFNQEPLWQQPVLQTSVSDKKTIDGLHDEINKKISLLFTSIESPFLLNQRHYDLLLEVEKMLYAMQELCKKPIHYELLSCHLNDALQRLTELTGKTISENSIDEVFKNFCVGK
jgi:tRNA modification GTPase